MIPLDERVALRYKVSIKTARAWIFWRWRLLTGRLLDDGYVVR